MAEEIPWLVLRSLSRIKTLIALVASTWYLAITSVLMVGQYFLERHYAKGSSRTMTARQLRALANARVELRDEGAGM